MCAVRAARRVVACAHLIGLGFAAAARIPSLVLRYCLSRRLCMWYIRPRCAAGSPCSFVICQVPGEQRWVRRVSCVSLIRVYGGVVGRSLYWGVREAAWASAR